LAKLFWRFIVAKDPDPKSFMDSVTEEFRKLHEKIDKRLPEKKESDPPLPEPPKKEKGFWESIFGDD
jgi:hypothetical protein